jgi:hypothetical protein
MAHHAQPDAQHEAHIQALEGRLNLLGDKLASLVGPSQQIGELIPVIHRPGWTTVAELALVSGLVDAMIRHTELLGELHTTLMRGAQGVGKG